MELRVLKGTLIKNLLTQYIKSVQAAVNGSFRTRLAGLHTFIPASNEPSIHASMDTWRMTRGSKTLLLCSAASLIPRGLQRGI